MTILIRRSNGGPTGDEPDPAGASPTSAPVMTLRAEETEQLLVQLVLREVANKVNRWALSDVERRLAMELARLGEASDARLLAIPRGLIARALRRLADDYEAGRCPDDSDLDIRYENAICREAVAELDAARAGTAG